MSTHNLNPALLTGADIKDPYGNTRHLPVLRTVGSYKVKDLVFYVQGDMYEEGDIRQFIVMAQDAYSAINAYDNELRRQHGKHCKHAFDTFGPDYGWGCKDLKQTFRQWWDSQPLGTRFCPARNFTPDVCLQLTV